MVPNADDRAAPLLQRKRLRDVALDVRLGDGLCALQQHADLVRRLVVHRQLEMHRQPVRTVPVPFLELLGGNQQGSGIVALTARR